MTEPRYTFIAYKPNSFEYARGCRIGSYSSDCVIINMLTVGELIQEWSKYLCYNMRLEPYEDPYIFTILKDGVMVMSYSHPLWDGYKRDLSPNDYDYSAENAELSAIKIIESTAIELGNRRRIQEEEKEKKDFHEKQLKEEQLAKEKRREQFEKLSQEFVK